MNMIAAYCQKQLFETFTVEGSCNRMVFETWLETCLISALQPGQVVIMENATFHKGGRIQDLIESVGCRLLYLPPYSPDLNRIEQIMPFIYIYLFIGFYCLGTKSASSGKGIN